VTRTNLTIIFISIAQHNRIYKATIALYIYSDCPHSYMTYY